MPNETEASRDGSAAPSSAERLDSWKEIAAYLKCSVRTVRRWETEGLPVHRHPHTKKSAIYAYKPEIDRWWNDGHARLASLEPQIPAGPASIPLSTEAANSKSSPKSTRIRWAGVIGAGALVLALVGWFFNVRRVPALTERDSILLGDFVNTTADPVFDGTLRQGLAVQLEQSPFFSILSDDQIAETLRLMEKPPDTRLTHAVAREVCQRAGATVEVDGSIAALGSQYVLGLNALNCHTGQALAQEQATAKAKDNVLAALTSAASELRSKLGESRASLEKYNVALDRMTTLSLEALQAYSQGAAAFDLWRYPVAAAHFERAVSLDPNFAAAHAMLATSHAFLDESNLAGQEIRRAYALRDRVSEREQLYISVYYCLLVTGDLEHAAQIAEAWTQAYPRDARSWVNLGYVYRLLGRNDEALAAVLGGVRLNPAAVPDYPTPILVYIRQGRWDQAVTTIREFEARQPGFSSAWFLYQIAFLRHDEPGMAQQVERLDPNPDWRAALETSTAAYRGQLARSRDLTRRVVASAKQLHASEDVAVLEARSALTEALYGYPAEAKSAATQAISPSASWDAKSNGALALALAGDAAQAQKVTADLNRRFPEGTFVQFYYLPAIRAALALHQGKPEEALESLRLVGSYEMAMNDSVSAVASPMLPAYIRGEAFLSAHQGAAAAAEFQKILDRPGFIGIFPSGALAHLGLGRAYALQGNSDRAKRAYQDFLTLWKDADPDIPVLKQAKAEYASLQ